MSKDSGLVNFALIVDEDLRTIIRTALSDMTKLLEETPCLSSLSLADQLNEIKKIAFEKLYAIGHETTDQDASEEVLKAIRALQDAFAQIIGAIVPMDNLRFCLKEIWQEELSDV